MDFDGYQFGELAGVVCFAENSRVTFVHSTFKGNTAVSCTLHVTGSAAVVFSNSSIYGNTAQRYNHSFRAPKNNKRAGGGVYATGLAQVTLNTTAVYGNNATRLGGGGLYADAHASIIIDNSNVTNNRGGGLHVGGNAKVTVTDSNISDNQEGGFYASDNATMTVENTIVINNFGTRYGGGGFTDNKATLIVTSSSVTNNEAEIGGGLAVQGYAKVTVTDSNISHNQAETSAGGFDARYYATITVVHSNISSNVGGERGGGGGKAWHNATVTLTNSSITDNTGGRGGGLYALNNASVTVTDCDISHNNASDAGGGIFARDKATMIVERSRISNNTSVRGGGGGWAQDNATLTVSSSKVSSNNATGFGGGIAATNNAILTAEESQFTANMATSSGGAVYMRGNVSMQMISCNITANDATQGGGLYYRLDTDDKYRIPVLEIKDSDIAGNSASSNGGGLYAAGSAVVTMRNSSVHDNSANHGGGLYGDGDATILLLQNVAITLNTASISGGGVFITGYDPIRWCTEDMKCRIYCHPSADNVTCATVQSALDATFNNTASFGQDITLPPSQLKWKDKPANHPDTVLVSKSATNEGFLPFSVQVIGSESGKTFHLRGVRVKAKPEFSLNSSIFLFNDTQVSDSNGTADFEYLKLSAPVGIYPFAVFAPDYPHLTNRLNFHVSVVGCNVGEVQNDVGNGCRRCEVNQYSFDSTSKQCHRCPDNANCTGGDVVKPLKRWVVQYILKGITDRDSPRENEQASSDVRGISAGNHAQAMEAIKIMLLYVQYMVLIKSANVRWPAALNGLFMVFSWFFATTNAQAISIVCLKILLRFPAAVVRFTYVAAPIAVLLATAGVQCWVFLGVYKQARRSNSMAQQQRITLCDRLAVSCLVVLYMFFPSLVRSGLAFFACYQLDTYPEPGPEPRPTNRTLNATGSYWLHNMDLKCFTGDHWT
eukprot:jgi/Chrzof1/4868/Cz15g02080.t1